MCLESTFRRCRPFKQAIDVTSNNVANANTPGYDEESIELDRGDSAIRPAARRSARASSSSGISRAYSQAAANQLNTSQSSLGQLNALQNYTSQIDNLFGTTAGGLEHGAADLTTADGRRWRTIRPPPPRARRCSAMRRALAANLNPRARSCRR